MAGVFNSETGAWMFQGFVAACACADEMRLLLWTHHDYLVQGLLEVHTRDLQATLMVGCMDPGVWVGEYGSNGANYRAPGLCKH